MAEKMNVESFNLDHRIVKAPYIRIADRKQFNDVVLTKFDVRFSQPNHEALESKTLHSLEHLMAEFSRNHSSEVIDISPMGCHTGFYFLLHGELSPESIKDLVKKTLTDVLNATEVPAANDIQCGYGALHSLAGAKEAARKFLAQEAQWLEVYA